MRINVKFVELNLPIILLPLIIVSIFGCVSIEKSSSYRDFYKQGQENSAAGDYVLAIENFSNSITLSPKFAEAYYERATAFFNLKEYQKAINDLSVAINLKPGFMDAYFNRALFYTEIGEYKNALLDINHVILLKPKDSYAYQVRGGINLKRGDNKSAIADFTEAIELDAKNIKAYEARAATYMMVMLDYPKALSDYEYLLTANPNFALSYYTWIGYIYMQLEEPEKALDALNKAIKIEPAPAMYLNRGKFYMSIKRYKEALEDINKAINIKNNYKEAYDIRSKVWRYMAEETDNQEIKRELQEKSDSDTKIFKSIP